MNDGEIEALEAQYKKAVYPSHVPGSNNIVFDSNLIEKGVRKLLDEVKAQKLQIETLTKDRDAWIGHHDTVMNTFTKTNKELQESNRLNDGMKNVVDAACALESILGFDDLNSAYQSRRETINAFVKAVGAWKTWLPVKRNDATKTCKVSWPGTKMDDSDRTYCGRPLPCSYHNTK